MTYKHSMIFCLLMFITGNLVAQRPQTDYDKEKLESAKVAFITNRLDLKPDQAEKFWPMFNKYSEERHAIMRDLSKIDHSKDADISESQAREMIQRRFKLQQNLLDKEKEFMAEVVNVISPKQAIKLSHVNREFTRQVYRMQRGRTRDNKNNP